MKSQLIQITTHPVGIPWIRQDYEYRGWKHVGTFGCVLQMAEGSISKTALAEARRSFVRHWKRVHA